MPALLICDDHRMFAEALALAFTTRGYDVTGIHVDLASAVAATGALEPNACIVDRHFPGADGLEQVDLFRRACPSTRVVILSGSSDASAAARARTVGADGYIRKDRGVEYVLATVERVLAGKVVIDDRVPTTGTGASRTPGAELARFLTPRERDVLQYLVHGVPTATIAHELGITYPTARSHIQNVLTKLGVHSKLEAVAFSITHGLTARTAEPV